jgi:gephyrin
MAVKTRTAGILTVSDRCSRGESQDTSGPNLVKILSSHSDKLCLSGTFTTDCIPDDKELIQKTLIDWVDVKRLSLILTTGGTGFSPSDITPESTKPLLDKEAPGLTFAMITKSLEITPMAMLSRPACGIRKQSLIINLPGSKKGSEECLSFILPSLPHALDLINESSNVLQTHGKMMTSHQSHDHHMHHTCSHGNKIIGKRSKEDFHPVALRPRQSPYPLVSIDDAINMILQNTSSCLATENKALKDALDCVLAESLIADQPFPPFPASIKDGYAVISRFM